MQKNVIKHARRWWALVFLSLATPPISLHAQTVWNHPSTNPLWGEASNWSNGLPDADTAARFEGPGGRIELDADFTNAFLSLTFTADNATYLMTSTDATVRRLQAPASKGGLIFLTESTGSELTFDRLFVRGNAASSFAYNGSNNKLFVTGAGSGLETAYNVGFSVGAGNGTAANNSGNTVRVEEGGILNVGLLNIGGRGANNEVTITGSGSALTLIGGAGQTNFNLNIGNTTADPTNRLRILDQATATVNNWSTNIIGGSLTVGRGSSLLHANATTREQHLQIGSKGTLYGAGTITATSVRYANISGSGGPGAQVYLGEGASDFATLNVTGDWLNTNLTLRLQVGDLTASPAAGVHYDFLSLNGTFTYGGDLVIDLATTRLPGDFSELRLIGWTTASGESSALNISFINGDPLGVTFKADGLYLTAIPEPGSVSLVASLGLGLLALTIYRRKRS